MQIETINQSLQQLKENITQINILHNTVLNSTTDEQRQEHAQRTLEQFTNETSRLTNSIKLRIKNLSELNDKMPNVPGNEGEKNTRRLQVAAQKKKCVTSFADPGSMLTAPIPGLWTISRSTERSSAIAERSIEPAWSVNTRSVRATN